MVLATASPVSQLSEEVSKVDDLLPLVFFPFLECDRVWRFYILSNTRP